MTLAIERNREETFYTNLSSMTTYFNVSQSLMQRIHWPPTQLSDGKVCVSYEKTGFSLITSLHQLFKLGFPLKYECSCRQLARVSSKILIEVLSLSLLNELAEILEKIY